MFLYDVVLSFQHPAEAVGHPFPDLAENFPDTPI
jgi:hypothetical protein